MVFTKIIQDEAFQLTYMRYDESEYTTQLQEKTLQMKNDLSLSSNLEVETFTSPSKYFRNRVKFGMVGGNEEDSNGVEVSYRYVMWEYGAPTVEVRSFPIACYLINQAMYHLREYFNSYIEVTDPLSQVKSVNFLSTTTKQTLVITLIYEKKLDETGWLRQGEKLRGYLVDTLGITGISIIAKARKQKVTIGTGCVIEKFELRNGRQVIYKQVEDGFSNPNGHVNRHSLNWLCSVVGEIDFQLTSALSSSEIQHDHQHYDLLELYCGNGNHTVAMSAFAKRVVAVELNKSLCETAVENLKLNAIDNVKIVHCDSAKFCNKILREKKFVDKDDKGSNIDYNFSTVLVDPPRAGLDDNTRALVAGFRDIIYISCNPVALKRDLTELLKEHEIKKFAVFDHFAYTHHLECGCYLSKWK